jgi:hypothetical protein
MQDEIQSHIENRTWTLVKRQPGTNVLKGLWVFRKSDGTIDRFKSRWTAKGFQQKFGIDYKDTFAPVLKYHSLRMLLVLAAKLDLELKQLDFVTAFLNAPVSEKVYVEQPHGFAQGGDDMVCELNKALYGIKQASHAWNAMLDQFLRDVLQFTRCNADICVYFRRTKSNSIIILGIFVDDILVLFHHNDDKEWCIIKAAIAAKFKVKDMGDAQFILGMKIQRNREDKSIQLGQELYISKVIDRFNMSKSKPVDTPESSEKLTKEMCPTSETERLNAVQVPYMEVVGSLLYAAIATRPDISHAVNEVCRYMSCHGEKHWQAAKRILRYLRGTQTTALTFKPTHAQPELRIEAYSDSDWASDTNDRKSTTGYVIKLDGCTVTWCSKKQSIVSLSSTEAEYIAIADTIKEVLWMRLFLSELTNAPIISTVLVDNQSAQAIAAASDINDRTKHIDTRFHFIREHVKLRTVELQWIPTEDQIADPFTKALHKPKFVAHRDRIMN